MKSLQLVIAVVLLLAGLAGVQQVQQFVLRVSGLLQDSNSGNGDFTVVIPALTANEQLIYEGKLLGVLSLDGTNDEILQRAAKEHADFQATAGVQGHQYWASRMAKLHLLLPSYKFVEVANESWPGQSKEDAAREMYKSWRQSEGHWSVVDGKCKIWGMAMAKGANGIWYACEIVGR
jgi:hypothetical protein